MPPNLTNLRGPHPVTVDLMKQLFLSPMMSILIALLHLNNPTLPNLPYNNANHRPMPMPFTPDLVPYRDGFILVGLRLQPWPIPHSLGLNHIPKAHGTSLDCTH